MLQCTDHMSQRCIMTALQKERFCTHTPIPLTYRKGEVRQENGNTKRNGMEEKRKKQLMSPGSCKR